MKNITINGVKKSIPTSWDEVETRHFIKIALLGNELSTVHLVAIFTDMPFDELYDLDAELVGDLSVLDDTFAFLSVKPDWKNMPVPETVTIYTKEINVMKDLKKEPYGAKTLASQKVASLDSIKLLENIPYILALYFHKYVIGKSMTEETRTQLETYINTMPITTTYPIFTFFLNRLRR